jgi:TPR repeat protein
MKKIVASLTLMVTISFSNNNLMVDGKVVNQNQLVKQLKVLTTTNPYVKNANFMLALYYFSGDPTQDIEPDYKKALEHMKKDIDNLAIANYKIGEIYYYGLGVEKDLLTAINWFHKAIEKEHIDSKEVSPLANAAIGAIYLNDLQKPKKAITYLISAANKNNVNAQLTLAFMYLQGHGINQNWDKADYWLNEAWKNPNLSKEEKEKLQRFYLLKEGK